MRSITAALAIVLTVCGVSTAQSPPCSYPLVYPGDSAPPEARAAWLAARAALVGVPEELPVMAALLASGLHSQSAGDRDSVGFFQMRMSVWNKGAYAGYPAQPELQAKWFLDQATAVRNLAMLHGDRVCRNTCGLRTMDRPSAQAVADGPCYVPAGARAITSIDR